MSVKSSKIKYNKALGQASLELSLALVCAFLLVVASVKICAWLAGQMADRQENYEKTRTDNSMPLVKDPDRPLNALP